MLCILFGHVFLLNRWVSRVILTGVRIEPKVLSEMLQKVIRPLAVFVQRERAGRVLQFQVQAYMAAECRTMAVFAVRLT